MSEMQRFAYHPGEGVMRGNDLGEYVRFIDAEAAIVQARSESREGGFYSGMEYGYQRGQRDMLARAIEAVDASAADLTAWDYDAERALAALRALAEGSER